MKKGNKMKNVILSIIMIVMIVLTACSNPVSSEYDEQDTSNGHIPLYSGHSENG